MRYINLRLTYLETEPGLVTFNDIRRGNDNPRADTRHRFLFSSSVSHKQHIIDRSSQLDSELKAVDD